MENHTWTIESKTLKSRILFVFFIVFYNFIMYERWDSKATFSRYKSQTWKKWNLINIGLSYDKNKSWIFKKNLTKINFTMKYYIFRHGHRTTHLKFHSKQFIIQCIPFYLTLDIWSRVLGVILSSKAWFVRWSLFPPRFGTPIFI